MPEAVCSSTVFERWELLPLGAGAAAGQADCCDSSALAVESQNADKSARDDIELAGQGPAGQNHEHVYRVPA